MNRRRVDWGEVGFWFVVLAVVIAAIGICSHPDVAQQLVQHVPVP